MRVVEEPLILSADTATEQRSVALSRGARTLALHAGEGRNTHSASLLGEIDAALSHAGVALGEVDLLAAAVGPGSFTGLRSGLATLKAFAATLDRPVCGVQTLHAVAHAAGPSASRVVAAIPAGRGEVFAQTLFVGPEGEVTGLGPPAHVAPAALLDEAARRERNGLRWAGSGARMMSELIRARCERESIPFREEAEGETGGASEGWTLARESSLLAVHVAALALAAYRQGRAVGAAELRAVYVRPSDAEIKKHVAGPELRST